MKTRFRILSDLHLEHNKGLEIPDPTPDVVTVICGDITESHTNTKELLDDLKKSNQKMRIYGVFGNHDYHNSDLCVSEATNHYEAVFIGTDTILILTTLWTDFCGMDPEVVKYCYTTYSDFERIKYDKQKIKPKHIKEMFDASVEFIGGMSKDFPEHKIVVATHFAPSFKSCPDYKYKDKGWFASDLEQFILDHPNIVLWCHGHIHTSSDYTIGNCRVVCNPYGFEGKWKYQCDNSENFNPDFVVEV